MTPVEPLLTVAELAAVLKMSEGWVRKGVLQRTLPFTKLGRSVRFTPEQAATIIARGQHVPRQPRPRDTPASRSRPDPPVTAVGSDDGGVGPGGTTLHQLARRLAWPRRPGRRTRTVAGSKRGWMASPATSKALAMACAITGSCRLTKPPYTS
jgi:excisionase family DNA binding protein